MTFAELKSTVLDLYNAPETRPAKVSEILRKISADKILSKVVDEEKTEKVLSELSALSTLEGISSAKARVTELATPIIEKVGSPDGRKEILEVSKDYAVAKIELGNEKVKEVAAPYLSSVKESSAPYVAKLEELRRSERVEAMVEAFKAAREHPAEKVTELKSKAIDLMKYETLREYRDHVMSEQFQADTTRLVKVELPAIAAAAAQKGAETLKASAAAFAEEIEGHKATVVGLVGQGYQAASAVDVEALKAKVGASAATLLALLQEEVSTGAEMYKEQGFSLQDVVDRVKRVLAGVVVEGKALVARQEETAEPGAAEGAEAAESLCSDSVADEYEDAVEAETGAAAEAEAADEEGAATPQFAA